MSTSPKSDSVKVVLRIRPLNPREEAEGCSTCLSKASQTGATIYAGASARSFAFDKVLGRKSSQEQSFTEIYSLLEQFSLGFNATLLAYGQTAAGKTHTVIGPHGALEAASDASSDRTVDVKLPVESGILPRAAHRLFALVRGRQKEGWACTVSVSALEVYREEAKCLVGGNIVKVRESVDGGVHAKGLAEVEVDSPASLLAAVQSGLAARATGSTAMNDRSSRSHALCCFTLRQTREYCPEDAERVEGAEQDDDDDDDDGDGAGRGGGESLCSKLYLVDLAGAERQKKTKAEGARLKEAVSINKGLLALGNVINALVARSGAYGRRKAKGGSSSASGAGARAGEEGDDDSRLQPARSVHIPYRDSKLTRLLRDSLGGNARTVMIACVSPADSSYDETLNTLRYASRARAIVNHATLGRDPQEGKIAALRAQVKQLQLALLQSGSMGPGAQGMPVPAGASSASGGGDDGIASRADAVSRAAERISELQRANASLERELRKMSTTAAMSTAEASDLRQQLASVQDQRDAAVGWIGQNSNTFDDIEAEALKIFASTRSPQPSPSKAAAGGSAQAVQAAAAASTCAADGKAAVPKPMCAKVSDEAAMSFLDEAFDGIAAELVQYHSGQQARLRSELSAIGRALEAKESQLKATSTSSAGMGVVGAEAAAEQSKVNARIKQLKEELGHLEQSCQVEDAEEGESSSCAAGGAGAGEEDEGKAADSSSAPDAAGRGSSKSKSKSKAKKALKVPSDPRQAARINELKEEIKSLQSRAKDLRRVQALRKKAEARSSQLTSEVTQLRKARQSVTRRMKQETQRFRDSLKQYEKEARELRKENRKTAAEATRLATLADRQRATLRQKTKDLMAAQRKLRERERMAIYGKRAAASAKGKGIVGGGIGAKAAAAAAGSDQQDASAETVLRDDNALLTSCAAPRLEGGAAQVLAVRSKHLRAVPGAVAACIAGEIRTHLALKGCEGLRESLLKARTQAAGYMQEIGASEADVSRAKAEVAELTQELAGVTSSQAKLRETSKLGIKVLSGSCKGFGWERGIADVRQGRAVAGWLLDVASAAVWHADKASSRAEQQVAEAKEALKEAQKDRDEAVSKRLDAEARAADASREAEERLVAFMGFSSGQSSSSSGSGGRSQEDGSEEAASGQDADSAASTRMEEMRTEIAKLAGVHDKVSRLETQLAKYKAEAAASKKQAEQAAATLAAYKERRAAGDGSSTEHDADTAYQKRPGAASRSGGSYRRAGGSKAKAAPGTIRSRGKASSRTSSSYASSGANTTSVTSSARSQDRNHTKESARRQRPQARGHDSSDSSDSEAGTAARDRALRRNRRKNYVLISESELSESGTDFYDDSSDSDWREDDEAPKPPPKTVKKQRPRSRLSGQAAGADSDASVKSKASDRGAGRGRQQPGGIRKSSSSAAASRRGKPSAGVASNGRAGQQKRAAAAAPSSKRAVAPPSVPNIRLSVVQRRPAGKQAKQTSGAASARGSVRDATRPGIAGSKAPSGKVAGGASAVKRTLGAKKRTPLGTVKG